MTVYPFIMAGGLGKRLAPISTPETPKQFLKLNSEKTMLQETLARLKGADFETPCIISNQMHEKLIAQQLGDKSNHHIILEAEGRGTAFAIGIAALSALEKDENALIIMLPCDHSIDSRDAFHKAVKSGVPHANQGSLVVLGAKPTRPETGFGYIETDEHANIVKFTEKPDIETAKQFIQNDNMLWNTGMFFFPAFKILDELETHAPEIFKAAQESWRSKTQTDHVVNLPCKPIKHCPNISIDYAVLEKARGMKCVKLETGWTDLGTHASLNAHNKKSA